MSLPGLIKKLHSLRDLRLAINEVKSLAKDDAAPAAAAPAKEAPQQGAQPEAKQESVHDFKHSGVKSHIPGIMTHIISVPGSDNKYEIHMNMHDMANKLPAFTVAHVDSSGKTKSMSSQKHDSIAKATKSLVGHAYNGKWDE